MIARILLLIGVIASARAKLEWATNNEGTAAIETSTDNVVCHLKGKDNIQYYDLSSQSDQILEKVKRVEIRLKEPYSPATTGDAPTMLEILKLFRNAKTIGLNDLSNLGKAEYYETFELLLSHLKRVDAVNALYVGDYGSSLRLPHIIQFADYIPNIERIVLHNSVVECAVAYKGTLHHLRVHDFIRSDRSTEGDIPSNRAHAIAILEQNSNVLETFVISTIKAIDFLHYVAAARRITFPNISRWTINYMENYPPYAKYELTPFKYFNQGVIGTINCEKLAILATDEWFEFIRSYGSANFLFNLLSVTTTESLTADQNVALQSLITEHKPQLKQFEITEEKSNKMWPEWYSEINDINAHLVQIIADNDLIDRNMDVEEPMLYANIQSGRFYDLLLHSNMFLVLGDSDADSSQKYAEMFARSSEIKKLVIHDNAHTLLRQTYDVYNVNRETGNQPHAWEFIEFIKANVKLDDKDSLEPIFRISTLKTISFVLPTANDAEAVKQWNIDYTIWKEGKALPGNSRAIVFEKI